MSLAAVIPRTEHKSSTGIFLAACAFALLTSVDTIFKLMAEGHPAWQILLLNACFGLVPVVLWALMTGGLHRLRSSRPGQQLLRGGISVMSAFAGIFAYSRLPLVDFYAIVFAGPLVVTAMSAFWLGEKVEGSRWLAVVIGFLGIIVVTHPFEANAGTGGSFLSDRAIMAGRIAALISVFCYALSVIMIRRMRMGESNLAFSFYGYIAAIIIAGAAYMAKGAPAVHMNDIAHLAVSGTFAGIASICLMTAYHRTPVALVAPFQYTQIIWGGIAGYFLWASVPGSNLVLGAMIVAASGLFVIYKEMKPRTAASAA